MVDGDQAEAVRETWHTPGPWEVDYGMTAGHIKAMLDPSQHKTPTVARYDMAAPTITQAEQEANARLIAAAPELLEALQQCYDLVREFTDGTETPKIESVLNKVEAAIAKATKS